MKILFVQKLAGISGSELYLLQVLPELKRRGHDVSMLLIYPDPATNNSEFIRRMGDPGIRIHEIYGHGSLSYTLLKKIARLLKQERFDLVQSNLIHADFWISMVKSLFIRSQRTISVVHGYEPYYLAHYGFDLEHLKRRPYYWIQRFAYRNVDYVVAISDALRRTFAEGGIIAPTRARTVYNGLTLDAGQSTPREFPDERFVVITGRLTAFKGHVYLIRAWEEVKKSDPGLKLYIVGDGELRSQLENQVNAAGLATDVIFWGHQQDPYTFMRSSLFTVVTSIWEGFGLIMLESWINKKAIVAFDAPAMNELIEHGVTGMLTRHKDPQDLARQILWLASHPEEAKQYGENGYAKACSYYNLNRMTNEIEAVYHEVCAAPLRK